MSIVFEIKLKFDKKNIKIIKNKCLMVINNFLLYLIILM